MKYKRITIEEALDRSELPPSAKMKIAEFLPGVIAGGGYRNISEALANGECPDTEKEAVQRAIRWALFAALFYPGQFIPFHHWVSYIWGAELKENSQQVELYRRNDGKKLQKRITSMDIANVGYITQVIRASDPSTVSGFRVTFDGDDYVTHVVKRSEKQAGLKLQKFQADVADTRVQITDVKDEVLQNELKKSKTLALNIRQARIVERFLPSPSGARLLKPKNGVRTSGKK